MPRRVSQVNDVAEVADPIYIYDDSSPDEPRKALFIMVEDDQPEPDDSAGIEAARNGDFFNVSLWRDVDEEGFEYDFSEHVDSIGWMGGYGGARKAACAALEDYFVGNITAEEHAGFLKQLGCHRATATARHRGSAPGIEMDLDGVRGLGAMAKRKREAVKNLNPLTPTQLEYLDAMGTHYAGSLGERGGTVWWAVYYGIDPDQVDWSSPYATFEPQAYEHWMTALADTMAKARQNKQHWAQLVAAGSLPPNPPKHDPYGLPEYLGWWQSENAFRRAFQGEFEAEFVDELGTRVRNEVRREGKLTSSTMHDLARYYANDPATAQFFIELEEAFRAGNAPEFGKVSVLIDAILAYRANAYIQFSPHHIPERAVGSFLFGVGTKRRRKRARTRSRAGT